MRFCRVAACLLALGLSCGRVRGMDAEIERAIPPDTTVLIEVDRLGRVFESALARDLWAITKDSSGAQQALASPEVERLKLAARFVENSLGVDWQTGLSRLTAGGIVIAVRTTAPGTEPDVTAIVTSDEEHTLARFLEAVHAELRRRIQATAPAVDADGVPEEKPAQLVTKTYREFTCYSFGNGHYAVVGRRMLAANRLPVLEAALDRLADPKEADRFRPPATLRLVDSAGKRPLASITLKADLLKQNPQVVEALKLPSNNPIAAVLAGGYLDLIGRADFIASGLFLDDSGAEVRLRLPVGSDGAYGGLRGYFASEPSQSASPLLTPPRTLFSASWYRDYARLWNSRAELFNPDLVKQIDESNASQRKQPSGLGIGDIIQMLGPHIRFVAARQQETVYRVPLEERFPAAAFVIDLADEKAFRERLLGPVELLLGAFVAGKKGKLEAVDYRGAKMTAIRFPETDKPLTPEQRGIYQINPAYTVMRGHFVVGSTAEIVRGVIDELDRLATIPSSGGLEASHLTDEQKLALPELSEFLKTIAARIVRDAVLSRGLTPEEAEKELELVHRTLGRIGQISSQITMGSRRFDVSVRIGRPLGERDTRPVETRDARTSPVSP